MPATIPSSFTADVIALEDVARGPKHPGVKGWDIDRKKTTQAGDLWWWEAPN